MTTRDTTWPQGTPAWTDLMVSDGDAAREFYRGLLGWEYLLGDAETGFYSQAVRDGRSIAGIGQPPPGQEAPPPSWTTYLAADDVEQLTARITEAGGTVLMPPMEIMGFGSMAVAADPAGAVFGLWQGGTHTGAQLVNEPGAMVWNETLSRDLDAAQAFYRAVFGYDVHDLSGEGFRYAGLLVGGQLVGGAGELADSAPAETPAHWMTYFAVEDCDATVARARELGGQVHQEPRDSPYGRMAVLGGPAGEVFAVIVPATGGDPGDAAD